MVRLGFTGIGLLAIFLAVYFFKNHFPFFSGAKTTSISSNAHTSFPPPRAISKHDEPVFDDFVGSEACAECHQEQYHLWKNSTHGRAGGTPALQNVIGQFDGKPRRFKDAVVTPTIKEQKYIFTVEQEGFPQKVFQVDAVIGGGHLEGGGTQTYFVHFPDGTLRFLPFDFIRKEKVWFGETKDKNGWIPISAEISITDLSEWPPSRILGAEQNFNNCQECHGSQIQTEYEAATKKYVTQYKSLSSNCESCHGAGKRHIELAKSGRIEDVADIGMKSLATLSKDESLEICFRCHALKDVIQPGYLPGKNLQAYYSLKFPILGENPYHPDGRTRAFAYQEGHLYSDCYLNGSITCVDCHDPHAQNYRDLNGMQLLGKFDNRQCTGCHASKALSPEQHSHHKKDSSGNMKDRKSVAALVLDDTANHPMAQVAGLCYFIENYLRPNMPDLEPEIVEKLKRLAAKDDIDLKAAISRKRFRRMRRRLSLIQAWWRRIFLWRVHTSSRSNCKKPLVL